MAITDTQREAAIDAIFHAAILQGDAGVEALLPGTTAAQITAMAAAAIGTTQDAILTTILGNLAAQAQAQVAAAQAQASAAQANVTAYTVT